MPPREGFTIAYFLTVADVGRSAGFYETVLGGRIQSRGDSNGAPGYIQIANAWLIVNVGGGPTPEKPSVTLSVPDPNKMSGFMNIRVAHIQACYELWKSRGAEFITEPISTARRSATCAIQTVILSKSDKASPTSRTVSPEMAGEFRQAQSCRRTGNLNATCRFAVIANQAAGFTYRSRGRLSLGMILRPVHVSHRNSIH
jgi:hypothetical protein